jgi:hypothetical protein
MTDQDQACNDAVQDRAGLPDGFWRRLTPDECAVSRAWAKANYRPGAGTKPGWHPIVVDECARMNEVAA